jgi:D-3-phosphoglycerate dehydrogenase
MSNKRFLIVNKMHDSIQGLLEEIGVESDYKPDITRAEVLEVIKDYWGIIIRSKVNLDKEFFDTAKNLKLVARAGAGLDLIDISESNKKGITIINAPEGNKDALAEHAIGLILSLLNKIPFSNNQVKSGIWLREENRGAELSKKTIGLLGFGHMGRSIAEKLSGFSCRILAHDLKQFKNIPHNVELVSLATLYKECDILSLHIPLTNENRLLVNKEWVEKFEKNIWLINTARGEVLNLRDLCEMLDSGKILGAALDVMENENLASLTQEQKMTFEKLANRNNTILTPHIGGWSKESYVRINNVLVSKIQSFVLQNG